MGGHCVAARIWDYDGAEASLCGWFDAVIGRYAVRINGMDCLAITKLDVLDELGN